MVLSSWLKDEADAFQVVEALDPVIEDLRRNVGELEEALISEYGYDQVELDQERQALMEVMRQMFTGSVERGGRWEKKVCWYILINSRIFERLIRENLFYYY